MASSEEESAFKVYKEINYFNDYIFKCQTFLFLLTDKSSDSGL